MANHNHDANHGANFNHDANHGANLVESEESEFKRPTLPPLSKPTIQQHQAFRQQLVNLMPKYNMRKGRPISRPKRWVYKTTFLLGIRKICCCCYFFEKGNLFNRVSENLIVLYKILVKYHIYVYTLNMFFFHIFLSRPSTTSSSNARPLQPSSLKATSDGQIKVRLMPSAHGITFTHPVISIQSPSHSPSHNSGKIILLICR